MDPHCKDGEVVSGIIYDDAVKMRPAPVWRSCFATPSTPRPKKTFNRTPEKPLLKKDPKRPRSPRSPKSPKPDEGGHQKSCRCCQLQQPLGLRFRSNIRQSKLYKSFEGYYCPTAVDGTGAPFYARRGCFRLSLSLRPRKTLTLLHPTPNPEALKARRPN